jgi:hypothetical protein
MKTGIVASAVAALSLGTGAFLFHFPETQILCWIKSESQARFTLQSGFISQKVLTQTTQTDWAAWSPTLDEIAKKTFILIPNKVDSILKFVHSKTFCWMSQMERHGKLIWGANGIDFNLPNCCLTHSYAALNGTYAYIHPSRRESANRQFFD